MIEMYTTKINNKWHVIITRNTSIRINKYEYTIV